MKTIIQLAVVLVVFLLVYNYFMGTSEEKETSKEIFKELKDVGVAVKDLLKSEKEKFDAGKYDNAIQKMRLLISDLETNAREVAPEYVDRIKNLEEKRQDLQGQLDQAKNTAEEAGEQAKKVEKLNNDMDQLMQETEQIMNEIKRKSEPD